MTKLKPIPSKFLHLYQTTRQRIGHLHFSRAMTSQHWNLQLDKIWLNIFLFCSWFSHLKTIKNIADVYGIGPTDKVTLGLEISSWCFLWWGITKKSITYLKDEGKKMISISNIFWDALLLIRNQYLPWKRWKNIQNINNESSYCA